MECRLINRKLSEIRCATMAEVAHWRGEFVPGTVANAEEFCREALLPWCREQRVDHKCFRSEVEWSNLVNTAKERFSDDEAG